MPAVCKGHGDSIQRRLTVHAGAEKRAFSHDKCLVSHMVLSQVLSVSQCHDRQVMAVQTTTSVGELTKMCWMPEVSDDPDRHTACIDSGAKAE